jgi:N-methylhydantoinase A
MGITVREAAAKIRQVIDSNMANAIFKEVVLKGYDPREFTIFAYGGGGPLHACGYAELLQIPKVVVPPNSPVFSASGAAGLDLLHIYEKSEHIVLFNPLTKKLFDDFDFINGMIDGFIKQAYAEFADEGHAPDDVVLQLELDVRSGGQIYLTTFKSPVLRIASRSDLALVLKAYFAEYADRFGDLALTSEVGVSVETVRIKASVPRSHWKHPKAEPATETTPALKEPRDCYWPSIEQSQRSPVYIYESFQPGHRVEGPAVVEGQSTTIALYPGWAASMDEHGFLILTREETQR